MPFYIIEKHQGFLFLFLFFSWAYRYENAIVFCLNQHLLFLRMTPKTLSITRVTCSHSKLVRLFEHQMEKWGLIKASSLQGRKGLRLKQGCHRQCISNEQLRGFPESKKAMLKTISSQSRNCETQEFLYLFLWFNVINEMVTKQWNEFSQNLLYCTCYIRSQQEM